MGKKLSTSAMSHSYQPRDAAQTIRRLLEAAPDELARQGIVPHRSHGHTDDRRRIPVDPIVVEHRRYGDVGERADRAGGAELGPAEHERLGAGKLLVAIGEKVVEPK